MPIAAPDRLVIVPGHASFKRTVSPVIPLPENVLDDQYWALEPFQAGEPRYYGEHISHGIQLANEDQAQLVFSGGRTREESGSIWSEALSYYRTAKELYLPNDDAYPTLKKVMAGIALEEFARDSFQNIEFPLLNFVNRYGTTPQHIKVVGWGFKEDRFKHHASTLGIPSGAFSYEGVNNPDDLDSALAGETKAAVDFKRVPRGDSGELQDKRNRRNPYHDVGPHNVRRAS